MSSSSVYPFIDRYHPAKDGKCSITICVSNQRKKKYYGTGLKLVPDEYDRLMAAKRRNDADKNLYNTIRAFENKASNVLAKLPIFTFAKFEEMYLENREASDTIASGFDKYIEELNQQDRVGTRVSYQAAKKSLEAFHRGLRYADITKKRLMEYENWMLAAGRSTTTVGIYLRSLRTIINRADVDKALYPFGQGKGKYSIPNGKNIKKALNLSEIGKIFNYHAEKNSLAELAVDYWKFIYLCNGINVKDLCGLQRKNIDGDILTYKREKTKQSKRAEEKIVVSLKPEAKKIILKWSTPSLDPEAFIFPHIKHEMTAVRRREIVQQLTKSINKYMRRIAKEIAIEKPVTTYCARHSFATVLKNAGVSSEFISEALGHSDMKTTKAYFASFENRQIHTNTQALTAFGN